LPLKISEIKSITKSIANFVWKHFTEESRHNFIRKTHTSELQAKRGIKSGIARYKKNEDKRVSARLLRAQGKTYRDIAKELGVSHVAIINWLRGGK
jgi:DNA invertase Pin-like site-specific DNA recombinase